MNALMRKALVPLILLFSALMIAVPVAIATDGKSTSYDAIHKLVGEYGSCSGVMIAPYKMLTAAHCDMGPMLVDGKPTAILKKDTSKDLMLLMVVKECPCVKVAQKYREDFDGVYIVGFPMGLVKLQTWGERQSDLLDDERVPEFKDFAVYVANVEGGFSGGGIFQRDNTSTNGWELIGTISAGSKSFMLGPNLSMIRGFLFNE